MPVCWVPWKSVKRLKRPYKDGHAPINAVEGFIRQIIGWREYVRGIYFLEGPDYTRRNALGHHRDLPALYWGAETKMHCLSKSVAQTRDEAYAHHIQRLMVTGNFALLSGIDPEQVHEWYLEVYADAFEWVEAPNTIGMSQFADGGIIASKALCFKRRLHQSDVELLQVLPLCGEGQNGRDGLSVQRALLGFSDPTRRSVFEQSADGKYVPHMEPYG